MTVEVTEVQGSGRGHFPQDGQYDASQRVSPSVLGSPGPGPPGSLTSQAFSSSPLSFLKFPTLLP